MGTGDDTYFKMGNSSTTHERITDTTPYGTQDIVWNVSNIDAGTFGGLFNSLFYQVDSSRLYRYSVWIKRKTAGNDKTGFAIIGMKTKYNQSEIKPYKLSDNL